MMQLYVDSEVYEKFINLKASKEKSQLSDSDFLLGMISHLERCDTDGQRCCVSNGIRRSTCDKTVCPECKHTASSLDSLYEHFETEHLEGGNFSCTCKMLFTRLPDFLRHYIDCPVAATDLQDPLSCLSPSADVKPVLKNTIDSPKASLEERVDNPALNFPELYSCRHPSVSPIAGPSDEKPYGCPKCFKGFKSKSLLDQHMHLHYPPRYKCRWCGNVYRWPPVYYHHKQKCKKRPFLNGADDHDSSEPNSSDEPPFKLEDSFLSNEQVAMAQQTLTQFMSLHGLPLTTPDLSLDASIPPIAPMEGLSNGPFACLCSEHFPSMVSYLEHVITCPRILSASGLDNFVPPPFGSVRFGLGLPASNFNLHTEAQNLSVAEDLSSSRSIQPNNGIFRCSICRKEFNSKLSLKQHVDGKHRAEGKYLCPTCGKRYRWGASFYYHKKTCVASEAPPVINSSAMELLTTNT